MEPVSYTHLHGKHMGQQKRQKDERVLGPLVQPDRAQPRLHRRRLIAKGPRRCNSRRAQPGQQTAVRVRHHRLRAVDQQRHVRPRVADVAEAAGKPLLECGKLIVAGKVDASIRGQHPAKDAQMRSYALRQQGVRAGSEVDRPPAGVLLPQIFEQLLVIRQVRNIDRRDGGDPALERGLSLRQPQGKPQQ